VLYAFMCQSNVRNFVCGVVQDLEVRAYGLKIVKMLADDIPTQKCKRELIIFLLKISLSLCAVLHYNWGYT